MKVKNIYVYLCRYIMLLTVRLTSGYWGEVLRDYPSNGCMRRRLMDTGSLALVILNCFSHMSRPSRISFTEILPSVLTLVAANETRSSANTFVTSGLAISLITWRWFSMTSCYPCHQGINQPSSRSLIQRTEALSGT